MLTWNQNFNGVTLKSTLFMLTLCKRSIFGWILSEITVLRSGACHKYRLFSIHNISKTKQTSAKKHTEHCLTHLNKTACEIECFWQSSLLSKKPSALFPPKPSFDSNTYHKNMSQDLSEGTQNIELCLPPRHWLLIKNICQQMRKNMSSS